MTSGIPVRLSEQLAAAARAEAKIQDRSLTDQVEHWARLGQIVEAAISAASVAALKARSHDPLLDERLAFARTPEGRARAAALIRERNAVRYEVSPRGGIVRAAEPKKAEVKKARRR